MIIVVKKFLKVWIFVWVDLFFIILFCRGESNYLWLIMFVNYFFDDVVKSCLSIFFLYSNLFNVWIVLMCELVLVVESLMSNLIGLLFFGK